MDPDNPDAAATRNFLASGGHEFNGKPIEPFTAQRMAVAGIMGMRWPNIEKDEFIPLEFELPLPVDGKRKRGKSKTENKTFSVLSYRQSFKDSIIVLWLCSQPKSRVFRAERKPDEAMDEAYAWADTIGLIEGTQLKWHALFTWLQICDEIAKSQTKPVSNKPGGKGPDEDSGEL